MTIELNVAMRLLEVAGTILKSVDYTVLDPDIAIGMTAGATDKIVTLPLLANSQGRKITVFRVDSGIGDVITTGDGSEKINGSLNNILTTQYEGKVYVGFPTEWRTS